jgi:hypothetical protein
VEIRRLKAVDLKDYFDHVERTYAAKGLLSIGDQEWVKDQEAQILDHDGLTKILLQNMTSLWAVYVNGQIKQSIRAEFCTYPPSVRLINYKSELVRPFNPVKDLLPLLDQVMQFFEAKQIYTFYLLRRLDFFASRRLKYFEDQVPLNRYNCYFEAVIPAGQKSEYKTWNDLMGNKIYPVDMGIASMHLKQEHRAYAGGKRIMPDTREYKDRK